MKRVLLIGLFQLIGFYFLGQTTFEFYKDDSIQQFFKSLPYEGRYFNDLNNLKDTLGDGIYIFYDVKRKDAKHKNIWIKGEYKNGVKEGTFETNNYGFSKKKRHTLQSQHTCSYKNGLKHGIEKEANILKEAIYDKTNPEFYYSSHIQLKSYSEYQNGKLHGLHMEFDNGNPIRVYKYENDEIIEKLLHLY
ncbi:MAG: hypothetical protein ACO1O6_15125 [Bacteroidota bacterium]